MSELQFSSLEDLFSQLGFEGATSGEDIVRILGERTGTNISASDQARFATDLLPLLETVRTGLGELPGRFSELSGQAQETARLGRESIAGEFAGRSGGLRRAAIGGRAAGRTAISRSGFAGSGAIERQQQVGSRALTQDLGDLFTRRQSGLEGIESGLSRSLFSAREDIEGAQGDFLSTLLGGVQNLRSTLRREGVFTGGGGATGGGAIQGDTIPQFLVDEYQRFRDNGGTLSFEDWLETQTGGPPSGTTTGGRIIE